MQCSIISYINSSALRQCKMKACTVVTRKKERPIDDPGFELRQE